MTIKESLNKLVKAISGSDVNTQDINGSLTELIKALGGSDKIKASDDTISEFVDVLTEVLPAKLPSGKIDITENGTGIDIAQYAEADVNVATYESELSGIINKYIRQIDIPGGFSTIGDYAFYNCTNLASVNFYSGNQTIGDFAFYGCTSLDNIVLPLVLRTIGSNAFSGCTGLKSVIIQSNSLIEIGTNAFYGCTSLTDIYYTGTQAEWEQITIGTDAIPAGATIHYEYTPE